MKLQDIFDQLSVGEFSQMAIGGQQPGVINNHNYKQVLNHINLGLNTLYRRFNLKQSQIAILVQPGKAIYNINSNFAVNNARSHEAVRYVQDTPEAPFKDDIHKILGVQTEFNVNMALNDVENPFACSTPSMTSLVLPHAVTHQTPHTPFWLRISKVLVTYQANHPELVVPVGLFNPSRAVIELPASHLEALLYFVASRVNNPIGMNNEFHAGNNYAAKFEQVCVQLENAGMEIDDSNTNTRACMKGFP